MGISCEGIRKKLEAAARYWAGERAAAKSIAQIDDNVIDGLIQAGAPDEVIESARQNMAGDSDDAFEVWEENWLSLLFFLAVSTQWNVAAGMSGLFYVGLNHSAVEANMNMRGIKKQARLDLCNDVLLMERAALEVLNKRDK